MRKFVAVVLTSLILLLTAQTSFAGDISPEEQARILEEKRQFIETLKGKSKEEQARMIAEFRARIFNKQATSSAVTVQKQEQLQTKIEGFRDQKKAQIAERVSTNLNTINDNRVNSMTKILERFQVILDKLLERVMTAEANGKDVTAAESAIASAQTSIDEAMSTVEIQASKDYSLVVGDESTVRADAEAKRQALMSDLTDAHGKVKLAKDAVVNAIRIAVNTLGKEEVDNEN